MHVDDVHVNDDMMKMRMRTTATMRMRMKPTVPGDTDDDDDDDDLQEVKSERERDVCDSSSMPRHVLLTVPTMCTAKTGADNERSHVDVSLDVDVNRRRAPSTGARSAHDGARHERGGRRSSPCSK